MDDSENVWRIMNILPNDRGENEKLKFEDLLENVNGYGRLVHYKLFGNSTEICPESCAILKV